MSDAEKHYGGKKRLSASGLRANVYQILDEVIATGEAIEIVRYGQILRIEPPRVKKKTAKSKLANLPQYDLVDGDPDELIHLDWSSEWRP